MPLAEGMHVGSYELLSPLGSEAGTEAWLARDLSSPTVLLRVLRRVSDSHAGDAALMRAVEAEIPLARCIEHPHLVRVLELARAGADRFIVSEFVAGRSLRQIQHRARTLAQAPPIWFTLHVSLVLCEALAYVHARCGELGTPLASVRQELSPDSVVVSFAGDPRWMSFGLTRSTAYVAPELGDSGLHSPLDHARADVYSAGLMLYEMLTSRSPFGAADEDGGWGEPEVPPLPSEVAPWVSGELEQIVLTAMARDASCRYRNAGELRQALLGYMEQAGVRPARKHLAQQVCGMLAPADSDPPSSARAGPSGYPPGARTRASDGPALGPSAPGSLAPALSEGLAGRPRESARDHAAAVWERLTSLARMRKAREEASAAAALASAAHADASRLDEEAPLSAHESAVKHFEQALERVRRRDVTGALAELEDAVRLDPENRVYLTNLRKLRKSLEDGEA